MYRYVSERRGLVDIPKCINPFRVLAIPETAAELDLTDPHQTLKNAFRRKTTSAGDRQDRALASIAYYMLTHEKTSCFVRVKDDFLILENDDVFVLAVVGYTSRVLDMISKDKSAVNARNHTLLYLAARSGFYDLTKALLAKGCPINAKQVDGSTALHGASFYGQKEIVLLLLEHGADCKIKNKWDNSPESEAESDDIKKIYATYRSDLIGSIEEKLSQNVKTFSGVKPRYHDGILVAKELCLNDRHHSSWEVAWHGTKYEYLESICKNGLKATGSNLPGGKKIIPREKHYGLNEEHYGLKNWAAAIFVSPSILYAAHNCYGERISSDNRRWVVLVKTYVRPKSYTKHCPTTLKPHKRRDGEAEDPEYRVEYDKPISNGEADDAEYNISVTEDDKILRVSSAPNVVVSSVMFILVNFLDNLDNSMTYEKVKEIFE